MTARRVTVLGATGSVGRATCDLIAHARNSDPSAYPIHALTAHTDWRGLAELALQLAPETVAIADESQAPALKDALAGTSVTVTAGRPAVLDAAAGPSDWVMAAIVGAAGLEPVLRAVDRGALVALANKEALVCAGDLVTRRATLASATLLPVDSEHNAIFQVLRPAEHAHVERLILTASGGPFRTADIDTMARATPEQAVAHPNWSMGAKISVDSATMMNKGLELIEAKHLFAMPPEKLDVVVHPQSVIHSLVAHCDGSVLAQLGAPDMRVPIAHTLAWPERMDTPCDRLDIATAGPLTFEAPDEDRFPALRLAKTALNLGDGAGAALNAANEIAVARFLDQAIGFLDISRVVEQVLEKADRRGDTARASSDLNAVLEIDAAARRDAAQISDGLRV